MQGFLLIQGYYLLWLIFPDDSNLLSKHHWTVSFSLVTTKEISVDFFSSGYLDISVPQVSLSLPMYSVMNILTDRFPHSEIYGSKLVCQLPVTYRRLQRPSSPLSTKASTECP